MLLVDVLLLQCTNQPGLHVEKAMSSERSFLLLAHILTSSIQKSPVYQHPWVNMLWKVQ